MSLELLVRYLETVVRDDSEHRNDGRADVPHSDRHRVLLAYLRDEQGNGSDDDRRQLREAAVIDAQRIIPLARVTRELARRGIECLILKGAAFSHLAYAAPFVRPRNDDDLWVRESDFTRACQVLQQCRYEPQVEMTSGDITRQRHFTCESAGGAAGAEGARAAHHVDLHRWPVNPSAFDALPAFETCLAESVPVEAIGPHARAPGRLHALLLACAHRVAHHTSTEDAMWLCDIYFLARALDAGDWVRFEAAAKTARIAHICAMELQHAREILGAPVPSDLIERLLDAAGEPSVHYLRPLGPLRDLWLELGARDNVAGKVRLLSSHLLPPRDYMAAKYQYDGVVLLPLLYLHRAVSGLAYWVAELISRLARS